MPPKNTYTSKRACDVCYTKKTVCSFPDSEGPCERCAHRGLECTFTRERPSKKQRTSKASSDVQILSQRITELESALVQARPSQQPTPRRVTNPEELQIPAPSKVNSPGISTSPRGRERVVLSESSPSSFIFTPTLANTCNSVTTDYDAGTNASAYQLGPNWFFNGMPISSEAGQQWLSTRTDQEISWAELCIPTMDYSPSAHSSYFSQEELVLPDQDTTRELMRDFFRSSFRLNFPVLEQVLFEKTMQTAYEPVDSDLVSPAKATARACVLGALSIVARSDASHQNSICIDADACSAGAYSLLMHLTWDISLETLQVVLLLQLQRTFSGHWQAADFLHSMACRIACSLRGHIYRSSNGLGSSGFERENHHTRTLFWICYMLDKDISLRTGNPPLLTEGYCDLTPPVDHLDYYTYLPTLDESPEDIDENYEHFNQNFPGDICLSQIKEKVCRQLFSAQALSYKDDQLLLHIRELDDEIERWRLSIPADFRPALFVSQITSSSSPQEGIPQFIRRMSFQLKYHYLMTVVHTTVRKCKPEAAGEIEDLHAVVHSSFDISLVASRSTLSCLKALVNTIAENSLRFITSYFTTAAISLFLNIVIHPLDPQAQLDLEVLVSASNTIRSIPAHKLTQSETVRAQEESKFVTRLVWLGTCAMTKAYRTEKTGSS